MHKKNERLIWRGAPAVRRAFTLTEMAVAFLVVGIALATLTQVGYWTARARVRNQQYLLAAEHAANLVEELRARPAAELTADLAGSRSLPDWLRSELGGGHAVVTIKPADALARGCRQVEVVVHWGEDGPPETRPRPVRLVAWVGPRSSLPKGKDGAP